jgi:hypothetical protein
MLKIQPVVKQIAIKENSLEYLYLIGFQKDKNTNEEIFSSKLFC